MHSLAALAFVCPLTCSFNHLRLLGHAIVANLASASQSSAFSDQSLYMREALHELPKTVRTLMCFQDHGIHTNWV